jgi:hypothetical protein
MVRAALGLRRMLLHGHGCSPTWLLVLAAAGGQAAVPVRRYWAANAADTGHKGCGMGPLTGNRQVTGIQLLRLQHAIPPPLPLPLHSPPPPIRTWRPLDETLCLCV